MPLITDSIGRVLGKRYRLVSPLGTGASAHVFLAEDVSLRRRVAVKVLLPALAGDESFLKRFGAEARSVAALNHPHILRVFDWGEDVDGPYLVLEYLHGGSLRDILDRGFHLSHAQAARLGAEAARALAYAHARGLVHRDVKPANLLFDEEGRVRIADFGVARALAEAAWTEPAGAMVGTARYASPEQALGRNVDGRADVYALAMVLYESLTGEVPFVTDTTVGTLMARVGSTLPHHPALGPLDDVLARAAAPEPDARLDAADMAARLDALAATLPPPEPLPLDTGHRNGSTADGDLRDLTVVGAFDAVPAVQPAPPRGTAPDPETEHAAHARSAVTPPRPAIRHRRRARWPWAVATGAVVVAAAAAAAALLVATRTPTYAIPSVAAKSVAAARRAALDDHLKFTVGKPVYSIAVPSGKIVDQSPRPGTVVSKGTVLHVVPSAGLPPEAIPSLSGLDCTAVEPKLSAVHLVAKCPALLAYDATVPSGQVINWSYDGRLDATVAPYGATVGVAISKGTPPVPVPAVSRGETFTQAKAALGAVGLQATEIQAPSTTVPTGDVVSTTPAAGVMAPVGTTVTVTVSTGPVMVAVPTVKGDTVQAATAALQQAGLTVGAVYGPAGATTVRTMTPGGGSQVRKGSAVTLWTQ
jgi:serine/threonine-protein kinase